MEQLERDLADLEKQEKKVKQRCENLESQSKSTRESLTRRAREVKMELDKLKNRMAAIRTNPNVVDGKMVNMNLILRRNTADIDRAVAELKREVAEFIAWLK